MMMELDFTAIRGGPGRPPESPQTDFSDAGGGTVPLEGKSPQAAKYGPSEGREQAGQLANRYREDQTERERGAAIFREYQSSIKAAGELRAEILKGVRAGEPLVSLFLKATECISRMTGDDSFCAQIDGDIRAIYGVGLADREPLEAELERVRGRLARLEAAAETAEGDDKLRIEAAITAHRKKISDLEITLKAS